MESSSPEEIEDDENTVVGWAGDKYLRMNFNTADQRTLAEGLLDSRNVVSNNSRGVKTREPKEGFRFIETKNSNSQYASSQRS